MVQKNIPSPGEGREDWPLLTDFTLNKPMPFTAQVKGIALRGEILVTQDFKAEMGQMESAGPSFRIVLLTHPQQIRLESLSHRRIAIVAPSLPGAAHGSEALKERQEPYQIADRQQEQLREIAHTYAQGQIITRRPLAFSSPQVFSLPSPAQWFERIVQGLFEPTWAGALPYAQQLCPELGAEIPEANQAQEARLMASIKEGEARLKTHSAALGQPGLGPLPEQVEAAFSRLKRLFSCPGYEAFYVAAEAIYGSPATLVSDLDWLRHADSLAPILTEVMALRTYLGGAECGDNFSDLNMDREALLEQLGLDNLLLHPHLWPSLKTLWEYFQSRYRQAYLAHHREYHRQMKEQYSQLLDKEVEVQALGYLNSIKELGEAVAQEALESYAHLREKAKPCPLGEKDFLDSPLCPSCQLKLMDVPPAEEVSDFLRHLEGALQEQQRRLSSRAVHLILAQKGGNRLRQFLQIVQASDLSGLAHVLDEELVQFIRRLLRGGK